MDQKLSHYNLKRRSVQIFAFLSSVGLIGLAVCFVCLLLNAEDHLEANPRALSIVFGFLTVNLLVQMLGFFAATKEHLKSVKIYLFLSLFTTIYLFIHLCLGQRPFGPIVLWNIIGFALTSLYIKELGKLYE